MTRIRAFVIVIVVCQGLTILVAQTPDPTDGLNVVAARYAHLVLALGQHDPDYVDAFYGPAEWTRLPNDGTVQPEPKQER